MPCSKDRSQWPRILILLRWFQGAHNDIHGVLDLPNFTGLNDCLHQDTLMKCNPARKHILTASGQSVWGAMVLGKKLAS